MQLFTVIETVRVIQMGENLLNFFRELSGQCNNLEHKLWGATTMMMEQYLPQTYADGKGIPRGGWRSATDTTGQTGNQRVKKFAEPCPRA